MDLGKNPLHELAHLVMGQHTAAVPRLQAELHVHIYLLHFFMVFLGSLTLEEQTGFFFPPCCFSSIGDRGTFYFPLSTGDANS